MRESWIDRWKGVLILFVVYGHAVGAAGNLSEGTAADILHEIRRIIYLFHMPAFFILAGTCWRPRFGNDGYVQVMRFLGKRFCRLIVPYIVFGVLSWLIFNIMMGTWNEIFQQMKHLLIADGEYKCNSVLWFLPVMFIVLLLAALMDVVVHRFSKMSAAIVLGAIVAVDYMVCFLLRYNHLDGLPFMTLSVTKYFFFFLVGMILKEKIPSVKSVMFMILVLIFCLPIMVHYDTRPFGGYSLWMVQGLSGALLSAAIVKAMPGTWFRWLEWIGAMSMGIMLIHKFPMVAIQEHIPVVRSLFGQDMFVALAGSVFVFLCSTVCSVVATLVLRKVFPWSIGERVVSR